MVLPETWRNLHRVWEITGRHLAFAQMPCKLTGFLCEYQDKCTQGEFLLKLEGIWDHLFVPPGSQNKIK